MFRLALLIFLLAAPAGAGSRLVPQLHDVTGVRADDVLNIRAAPTAGAAILGTLAPGATGIEVVAVNPAGTWGQVNHGEATGWVSLRYMRPRGIHIDNYNMPVGMRCFGTEPFWSLRQAGGALRLETPGQAAQAFEIEIAQDTGIPNDMTRMIRGGGGFTAFLHPALCSDGMSDRAYGLRLALMAGAYAPLFSGCCTLQR